MRTINFSPALGGILLACCTHAMADPVDSSEKLHQLFEQHHELQLERQPIIATFQGDHRFNDRFENNIEPSYFSESFEIARDFKERVSAIDPANLNHEDRINRKIFIFQQRQMLEGQEFPSHLLPINQFDSIPLLMTMMGSGQSFQPFNTAEDYFNFLGRMEGFAEWADQAVVNMREGMKKGVVQPRVVKERALGQLKAQIVDDPEESLFWTPVANIPEDIDSDMARKIEDRYRQAIA